MDSIVHIENYKFTGRTTFRGGLLNSIVELSVRDIKGVARLQRDVKIVTAADESMTIDVSIWLEPGYAVSDVSYRVQESVIAAALSIIDKKIKSVNITIANVSVPQLDGGQLVGKRII